MYTAVRSSASITVLSVDILLTSLQEYDKKSEELDSLRLQKKEYELRLESLQAALNKSRQVS